MPANFAVTPTSTTTLSANQFPVSAVFVPGTASGNLTAVQGGPATTDGNGYTSAPFAIYVADGLDVTQGVSTDAANANSVIGQLKQIKSNTASVTIGSLPSISGTVTANQGGSWSVTANAGTNLNTSALALDTSVNGVIVAQGSTTSGQKGPLLQGAVTTASPSYTTAQTSPISLTPAGAVRVDASATTQPVSGTFWQATQPISAASLPLPSGASTAAKQPALGTAGTASSDVLTVQGIASMTALKVDGSGVTQPVSGTITANIGTTNGLALDATVAKLNVAQGTALGSNTGPMLQASVTTGSPTYSTGNINPLSLTTAGALRTDASATTQPVSGTVSVNALPAGSNTIGGVKIIDTGGTNVAAVSAANALKVDGSAVTQPVSGTVSITANSSVNVAQIGGTNVVTGGTAGLMAVGGPVASGASNADNPLKIGGVFNTTQPTVTNGQVVDGQYTARGAALVATGVDTFNATINAALPAGGNTIGAVTQASGPWTSNVTQWNGTTADTNSGNKSAGTLRVVLATDQPALTNALKVDGSAVTQPVSGTVTANQGGAPWTQVPNAGTSGGSTPSHTMSAASTNATSLKASAGMVYGLSISNANASARYFKLYNKASAPTVGTDTPILTLQVPGSGTVIRAYPVGLALGTGIAWAATGVITDADTTAIGLNDLSVDIDYK